MIAEFGPGFSTVVAVACSSNYFGSGLLEAVAGFYRPV